MTTGKELFIGFTASAFRKLLSIYVFCYFPFGLEGRMWDLIVLIPDHCLSFYFSTLVSEFILQPLPQVISIPCSSVFHANDSTVKNMLFILE